MHSHASQAAVLRGAGLAAATVSGAALPGSAGAAVVLLVTVVLTALRVAEVIGKVKD
jgi:hypothetical protein